MDQTSTRRRRRIPRWLRGLLIAAVAGAIVLVLALLLDVEHAYIPSKTKLLNPQRINEDIAYDVWGRSIRFDEAQALMRTEDGRALLSPANGAIPIDGQVLQLGRQAFYAETFGNEVFTTQIVGLMDGPLTRWEIVKAVLRLRGRGTSNLRVRLAEDVTLGGRTYRQGEFLDTGLDVVPGTYSILGVKIRYAHGRLMGGITCAACHRQRQLLGPDGVPAADVVLGYAGSGPGGCPHPDRPDRSICSRRHSSRLCPG